ncbi:MAG TPA: hypothetical protein VN635_08350 [Conexibacter sp.]|nr:hypothetical protein [Conexibacter sp.]
MRRKHVLAAVAAVATMAWLVAGGVAQATFPNFSDCPVARSETTGCVDIQSVSGSLEIKGFTVPLGESLEIRGGLDISTRPARFIPPRGTTGFFAKPVRIPGGILGIEIPIPGNAVNGIAELAGSPSDIQLEIGFPTTTVSLPVKIHLENPILGPFCTIGTNSNPAHINFTTGTTSPPPPNRPITGSIGTPSVNEGVLILNDSVSVDNSFAIPGASGCGLLGIFNPIVNLKLGLPSAGGNNTMIVHNNVALH